jgi:hypothetical protein
VYHRAFAKDLILSIQIEFVALFVRTGGESVSQSPLKDKVFSTFLDKNPRFGLRPENGISSSTKASPPNARRCHQATSEGQIAIAPLGLIAVRSGI